MKVGSLSYRTFSPLAQAFRSSSVAFSADNNFALLGIAFLGDDLPRTVYQIVSKAVMCPAAGCRTWG